jgi:hypothetical protein
MEQRNDSCREDRSERGNYSTCEKPKMWHGSREWRQGYTEARKRSQKWDREGGEGLRLEKDDPLSVTSPPCTSPVVVVVKRAIEQKR